MAEARKLFDAAGLELPEPAVVLLQERTEGWAAGLRLAALSLAGRPDPARFAAEFLRHRADGGRVPAGRGAGPAARPVRRLLLRTRACWSGSTAARRPADRKQRREADLQDLEEANAFVVALDAARSWFRYHRLLADLLQLELRRAAPGRSPGCAGWRPAGLPGTGSKWRRSGTPRRRGTGPWPPGCSPTTGPACTWTGRPSPRMSCSPGSPPRRAQRMPSWRRWPRRMSWPGGRWTQRSGIWGWRSGGRRRCPADRRVQLDVLLGIVRLLLARQRGNLPAVAEQARRLQALAEAPEAAQPGLGEDLRALALISLGITEVWTTRFEEEVWTTRFEEAQRHLEQGVALARRIGRPYLEFTGLAHQAAVDRSFERAAEHGTRAVELARRHGWNDEPAVGIAYMMLGTVLAWQGRPEEAEPWVQRAERTVRAEAEPAAALAVHYTRGLLELVRGRDADALAALRAAERLAGLLAAPHVLVSRAPAFLLLALVRLGETERAEEALAGLEERERERGEVRIAIADLRLAQEDPHAATAALAPVIDGSARADPSPAFLILAFALEASARDALGDPATAGRALERALDLAEPNSMLTAFLLHPAPGLLERRARHRTSHAALIGEILSLVGRTPAPPPAAQEPPLEPLTDSEIRVLRYLPTNLSMPEIASELYVSRHTVKTHGRHLYAKLGTHRRADTVARARALGLLAPSPSKGQAKLPG